jgi:hypothetical protein
MSSAEFARGERAPRRAVTYLAAVRRGLFASLLLRDRDLAGSLVEGFETLWRKAMRNLQEVDVDPRSV